MRQTKRIKGMATVNLPFLKTKLVVYNRKADCKQYAGGIEIYNETGTCRYNGKEYTVWRTCRTGEWHHGIH